MTETPRGSSGKKVVILLIIFLAVTGYALYQLMDYAAQIGMKQATPVPRAVMTARTGEVTEVPNANFQGIDAVSSPTAYRSCFFVAMPLPLDKRFKTYADPVVPDAVRALPCFKADAVRAALKSGTAHAYLGQANISYGVDRVVAVMSDGNAIAWNQLNACGTALAQGAPLPKTCPPPPEKMNAKLAH